MGDAIRVSDAGLHTLATQCDMAAIAVTTVPPIGGPPHQATAVAVAAGHAAVAAAGGQLATRATSTGDTLRAAAGDYRSADYQSAQNLSAVGRVVEA